MSLENVLSALLFIAAPFLFAVAGIKTVAAIQRPRIRFLLVSAILSWLIAFAISTYDIAIINLGTGSVISVLWVRIAFRLVLLGISIYPFVWLYLFLTGKFDDR